MFTKHDKAIYIPLYSSKKKYLKVIIMQFPLTDPSVCILNGILLVLLYSRQNIQI